MARYLRFKKLALNIAKTKCMIIGNRNITDSPRLEIDGEEIERVKTSKYLGIQVDKKLNFVDHVDYVIKKVAVKYGILCRINKSLTFWAKLTYVRSVISS